MLFLQLLEPCPTMPFVNHPLCQNNRITVYVIFWYFSVALARGWGSFFLFFGPNQDELAWPAHCVVLEINLAIMFRGNTLHCTCTVRIPCMHRVTCWAAYWETVNPWDSEKWRTLEASKLRVVTFYRFVDAC